MSEAVTATVDGPAPTSTDVVVGSDRRIGNVSLNDRERAVLRLLANGLGTSEIAAELAYSERTIKNIIHGVTTRLRLRNRCHAVAYVIKAGIM